MTRQAYVGTRPRIAYLAALSAAGLLACASPASTGTSGNGGSNGSGNGGSNNSGNGGSSNSGGSNGTGSGGSNNTGNGGSNNSGNGGSVTTGSGGSNTGSGGSHTGGTTGAGGSNTGSGGSNTTGNGGATSTGGAGGAFSGTNPPGYYSTKDWSVSSVDWHGCVWTGKDSTVTGSTTSVTPQDFTAATKEGGPYEVNGTVYNDYNAVAMLGFNLNEAPTSSNTQCKYNAAAATQAGPPAATIPSSATGIAVNWTAKVAPPTSFRIQIQGVDGATNAAHRWCTTITDAQGPSFAPFSAFSTQCWTGATAPVKYMNEPIDAVVFLVPGDMAKLAPFDFTIVGFAPGTTKADAPGGTSACGTIMGSLGSTTASMGASYGRAAVTGSDCKKYIVQNNNWGNPTGSTQVVNYTGTGFTVASSSGSGSSAPASFPSTYVGANGNVAGGTYDTWSDTGLPKQISSMQSAMTSFGWSGGSGSGQFNATYDVWFAKTPPTAGSYEDGVSGFIMVWLRSPSNFHPIGTKVRSATIAGHTWDVWAGPRGQGQGSSTGTDGAGRPVISYVISGSSIPSLSFDLKNFIDDAVTAKDTANGITQAFSNTWYLTDVFAGFEIWSGGDATGLKSTGFSIAVK
ncbi:MAG: GH12 family glycosyl hydrolase domain-containing protein [Polyangia bacterium]